MLTTAQLLVNALPAVSGAEALHGFQTVGVVPVLVGPLQALIAILPGILIALGGLILTLFRWRTVKKILLLLWRKKLGVTLTVGVAVGLVYGLRAIWPESGPRATAAAVEKLPWAMFRRGPARSGAVPGTPEPVQPGRLWAFTRDCKTFYSSPCVVGNRVYIASTDKGPLRDRGAIYCLDAENGALVWKSRPRRYLATFSSPSVAGKYLVVGEGLHYTRNARVVCLDVERNGTVLWTFRTRSHVESSPAIDLERGRVYIGAGDDGYYCLALEPDGKGKARVIWHLPGPKNPPVVTSPDIDPSLTYPDAETSPLLYRGRLYFGLGLGGNALCCVDPETGKELWRVKTPYPVFGPATALEGKLFIAMGNGNFIQTAEEAWAAEQEKLRRAGRSEAEIAALAKKYAPGGEIWAIDPDGGKVLWTYRVGRVVLGAVAGAEGGRLYAASRDGKLYCLSTAGELLSTWNARAPLITSPAVTRHYVYLVSSAGVLYCLERERLQPVWEETLGLSGRFISSPAVGRGHIYVGTEGEGFLCLGRPVLEEREPVWAGRLGGPGRSGWSDGSPVPRSASYAWRYPEALSASDTAPVRLPVMPFGGAVYVAVETARRTGLARLDLADPPARKPTETWFVKTALPVNDLGALGEEVFLVTGRPGRAQRRLLCLSAADGRIRWERPVDEDAPGKLLVTRGVLYLSDTTTGLTAVNLRGEDIGKERWRVIDIGRVVGPPVEADEGLLAAAATGPDASELVGLDAATGAVRWRRALQADPTTGPVYNDGLIAVGTEEGVSVHSVVDGSLLWQTPVGRISAELVADSRFLMAVTAGGELVMIDWVDGHEHGRIEKVQPGLPPVVLREGLLYATAGSVQYHDFRGGAPRRWMRTDWMGPIVAPVVLMKSHAFVPTAKRGLVCARPRKR